MNQDVTIRDFSMLIALGLIWVFFSMMNPQFISPRNITNLSIELSITSVLALGMLLVLLPGEIDLSVGSGVGLTGGIASSLVFFYGWPTALAMLASLTTALALWFLMSKLITTQNVPSFIITLGGLLVFKGIFWLVIRNQTVSVSRGGEQNIMSALTTYSIPPTISYILFGSVALTLIVLMFRYRRRQREFGFELESIDKSFMSTFIAIQALLLMTIMLCKFRGLPISLVVLGVVSMCVSTLTRHTAFGRYLYAIGGNKEAAALSGISVEKVICTAYVILGALVALTGFMQAAYQGSSTTTVGDLMELDAIAACVIGGTSLKGGRGTVAGVIVGSLIMVSLLNGMTLLAVSPEVKFIARGSVLVLAVWMDVYFSKTE
ncbi:MAG: ATPase [Planctomycetota bacterium]